MKREFIEVCVLAAFVRLCILRFSCFGDNKFGKEERPRGNSLALCSSSSPARVTAGPAGLNLSFRPLLLRVNSAIYLLKSCISIGRFSFAFNRDKYVLVGVLGP